MDGERIRDDGGNELSEDDGRMHEENASKSDEDGENVDDELPHGNAEIIESVCKWRDEAFDLSLRLEEYFSKLYCLDISDMLRILSETSDILQHFDYIINCIFSLNQWRNILSSLGPSTVGSIIEKCVRLYNILSHCEKEWNRKMLEGGLTQSCQYFRGRAVNIIDLMMESMGTSGMEVRKQLGKSFETVIFSHADDYPLGVIQRNPIVRKTKQKSQSSIIPSIFDKDDLSRHMTISEIGEYQGNFFSFDPSSNCIDNIAPIALEDRPMELKLETETEEVVDLAGITTFGSSGQIGLNFELDKPITESYPSPVYDFTRKRKENCSTVEKGKNIKVNFTARQRQLMLQKCIEMLSESAANDHVHEVAEFRDTEELPHRNEKDLKYLLLARITRGMQSRVINILRSHITDEKSGPESLVRQQFRLVFLIDNSGSMDGDKMALSLTILIILLEAFKRVEYDTAVVRFGGEQSQEILKSFTDNMTNERGQFIIEAFDSSEKTLTADAVKYVSESEELFKKKKESDEHRLIIIITDGIWGQIDSHEYHKYFSKADAYPLIITTKPRLSDDRQFYEDSVRRATEILQTITRDKWFGIDPEGDLMKQISVLAEMINKQILFCLDKQKQSDAYHFGDLKFASLPSFPSGKPTDMKCISSGSVEWGTSIYASNLECHQDCKDAVPKLVNNFMKRCGTNIERILQSDDPNLNLELPISDFVKIIDEKEKSLCECIADLDNVLDSVVLRNNCPTRAVPDYRGTTISLPGFIRYICTDGQYKKIYENMIGHPRKDYRISVILDTSASMAGMSAIGSMEVFLALAASLRNIGVDFSLNTAAENTNIVKSFYHDWDNIAKARAYSAIQFDEQASNIADSILYATELALRGGSSRTVRMIFVITDGYDSSPGRLRLSLLNAESQGVTVIGIGIGFFTDGVRHFFPRHIAVHNPALLAKGFSKFFSGELDKYNASNDVLEGETVVEHDGKTFRSATEIWKHEMKTVYDEEVKKTKNALYFATNSLRLKCSTLSIDLCFVMDTTGSMRRFIEMAKKYTLKIVSDIKASLVKFEKIAELRIGFVSYKCSKDADHCKNKALTTDIDSVVEFIKTLTASGGYFFSSYEDKVDGLAKALEMKWSAHARFLVLIGDQPDYRWVQKTKTVPGVVGLAKDIAKKKIYFLHVRIDERTDNERVELKEAYTSAAPQDLKTNGFISLEIEQSGASENLMKIISDKIEDVITMDFM